MAVYTHVEQGDLAAFLNDYDIGDLVAYKGIAEGVENSNYLLRTARGDTTTDYILTLYERRVAEKDLPFFLNLVDHLSANGIACPAVVHARDGVALRRLSGRPAAIFTFLDGVAVQNIFPEHCYVLGRGLAELHLAGLSFEGYRANDLSLDGWRTLADKTAAEADQVSAGLKELIANELAHLKEVWPRNLPAGVIHADLFPDNVFFLDGRLSGFIDFYFACNDLLAYDLAICLNAWCFDDAHRIDRERAAAVFDGYRQTRKLQAEELAAMPILARGAALRFLLTRLYDLLNHPAGAFVQPKDPLEYLTKLNFHRGIRGVEAYGLG